MDKISSYYIGIDAGSTTLKVVILDENLNEIYKSYERHLSKVKQTALKRIASLKPLIGDKNLKICITGSAGLGLCLLCEFNFLQEVIAANLAINHRYNDIDVCVELGGEDAKILFLTGGVEERMNGTCAGGTGAFIDQMATLMNTDASSLNNLAKDAKRIYPIASRCGVFAKSDIQPLLNQGANKSDIAASIYDAVVLQSITGLAQGREIKGKVLFLGGPLKFSTQLVKSFKKHLNLDDKNAVIPQDSEYFIALGAALKSQDEKDSFSFEEIIKKLQKEPQIKQNQNLKPLFQNDQEYENFKSRHAKHKIEKSEISSYEGDAFLGIDCGSTTLKIVLLDTNSKILYSFYGSNEGNPLEILSHKLKEILTICKDKIKIKSSAVTGYGEEIIKSAFGVDFGLVETVAHLNGARFFNKNVDFIIDIGGQDMKSFSIKNGEIFSVTLNEACSSGCGSFLSSFAKSLGYEIGEFSKFALQSKNPANLGSRCTVFMNSSVKQAQKDGTSIADISAGLAISVVKNAIYKVLRVIDTNKLGKNIVVQGGTFLNDAVLRAFEMEIKKEVLRMDQSEIMGAFGASLFAKNNVKENSNLISLQNLENFNYKNSEAKCKKCPNFCSLHIIRFDSGTKFVSGNRCERGAGLQRPQNLANLYEFKRNLLDEISTKKSDIKVGIPLCLNMYELLPFWIGFFDTLNIQVVKSKIDSEILLKASASIPSDTVCFPAKLVHSHIQSLKQNEDLSFIFYPNMSYNIDEKISQNHYNCPVVAYYPELINANMKVENFLNPHIDFKNVKFLSQILQKELKTFKNFSINEILNAIENGFKSLENYKNLIRQKGDEVLQNLGQKDAIILASRPYHIDSKINHGIDLLLNTLGFVVLSEDCLPLKFTQTKTLNQWTYHARMYNAARIACENENINLVQLVSFGCGIDAITSDEIERILSQKNKIYTQLKIDEITNLGGVKIRLRSLKATLFEKRNKKAQK